MAPPMNISSNLQNQNISLSDLFARHLQDNETTARLKYRHAFAQMRTVSLSSWFYDFIDTEIVPLFFSLGIEPELTWAVFKMAGPSWQSMKPASVKGVWFNPLYVRVIKDVKHQLEKKAAREKFLTQSNKRELAKTHHPAHKQDLNPEDLEDLVDDVSLSWIILPRAYSLLEKTNAREISGYLRYLRQEADHDFQRLISHILIEYVGNFALKYMSPKMDKRRMIKVLFYGYATMFWKTLRSPLIGQENDGIHDVYLKWASSFMTRAQSVDKAMERTFEWMVADVEKIFAPTNPFGISTPSENRLGALFIALRHGNIGLATALNYFGFTSPLSRHLSAGGLSMTNALEDLSIFMTELKRHYPIENEMTKKNIIRFLDQLNRDYMALDQTTYIKTKQTTDMATFIEKRLKRLVKNTRQGIMKATH